MQKYRFLVLLCLPFWLLGSFQILSHSSTNDILAQIDFGDTDGTFPLGEAMKISYKIKNNTALTIRGVVEGSISTNENKIVQGLKKEVEIPPKESKTIFFQYKPDASGIYRVFLRLKQGNTPLTNNGMFMGYGLDDYYPPLTKKNDFDVFWKKMLLDLAKISPQFKLVKKATLSNNAYTVYLLEMQSLNHLLIKGWYRVPNGKKNIPVVLQLPSLGGAFYNIKTLSENPKHGVPLDFAVLSLNIRGHGNSKNNVLESENYNHFISIGIEDKDTYIYKGVIADCIRAVDFLMTRPELDKKRIAVEGGSQGGALSLIVAALDTRISLCAPDVPFLSDIENLLKSAQWVSDEMNRYIRTQPNLSMWRIQQNLTYFDTKNFAPMIEVPVLMSIGLQDWTCPAATCVATFNHIKAEEKTYIIYPEGRHEGGGAIHRKIKFDWIRNKFGMN